MSRDFRSYINKHKKYISIFGEVEDNYFNGTLKLFYKKDMSNDELLQYRKIDSEYTSFKNKAIQELTSYLYNLIVGGLDFDGWIDYNCSKDENFFFVKSICQGIVDKGVTIPLGVHLVDITKYDNLQWREMLSEYSFNDTFDSNHIMTIHPGANKLRYTYFLNIDKVPIYLECEKSSKINTDGFVEIKSMEELKEKILDNSKENIGVVWMEVSAENDGPSGEKLLGGRENYGVDFPVGIRGLDLTTPGGNWIQESWLLDYPVKYCKILKNSFPLNIYIGNVQSDKEYIKRIEKIKEKFEINLQKFAKTYLYENNKSDIEDLPEVPLKWRENKDEVYPFLSYRINLKDIVLHFNKVDNVHDIPKLNNHKGFCIYTDCDVEWKRDILELFYFTNSEKAFSTTENQKVMIFNAEHSMWKFTSEFVENFGMVVPRHYE